MAVPPSQLNGVLSGGQVLFAVDPKADLCAFVELAAAAAELGQASTPVPILYSIKGPAESWMTGLRLDRIRRRERRASPAGPSQSHSRWRWRRRAAGPLRSRQRRRPDKLPCAR